MNRTCAMVAKKSVELIDRARQILAAPAIDNINVFVSVSVVQP